MQLAMDFIFSPSSFPVHSCPKNENGTSKLLRAGKQDFNFAAHSHHLANVKSTLKLPVLLTIINTSMMINGGGSDDH